LSKAAQYFCMCSKSLELNVNGKDNLVIFLWGHKLGVEVWH